MYHELVDRLLGSGTVALFDPAEEQVAFVSASKSDGSLRLAFDCRASNQKFVRPPATELSSGPALSDTIVEEEGDLEFEQDETFEATCIASFFQGGFQSFLDFHR